VGRAAGDALAVEFEHEAQRCVAWRVLGAEVEHQRSPVSTCSLRYAGESESTEMHRPGLSVKGKAGLRVG